MKSNLISKSKTAEILEQINSQWNVKLSKQKNVRFHYITDNEIIITGTDITAVMVGNNILPFLSETAILKKFPSVVVDMGAIQFVCKGANIMRPGIKEFSDFKKGDIVCVIEESQQKFLAVGIAEMSSDELKEAKKGEVIKNIHYISDNFWEIGKELSL